MRVLWLCNVPIPAAAEYMNLPVAPSGGWLEGAAKGIANMEDIELFVVFPQMGSPNILSAFLSHITYYAYPASKKAPHCYDKVEERWLSKIVCEVKPDIVHIWGTEYSHALAMTRVFACSNKTIISIQGLCGYIGYHYRAFLPEKKCKLFTIRDWLKRDRIADQQIKFFLRGDFEKKALLNVGHIIGRTRWDYACVKQLAPKAQYYKCNETLRESFYRCAGTWSLEKCQRHSLFVSQASYPLKGFHMVLRAMPEILKQFPDAKLYTTGCDPFSIPFYRVNGYQKLLIQEINELRLKEHVVFLGLLNEEKMCKQFLRSHVFVSASSIENSPNSVGEAMLLGVPTVASYVGGTMDLLKDGEEGFLYQADASYMLADHVCRIFNDDEMANRMGRNATAHAKISHDAEKNLYTLLRIYKEVYQT